MVYAPAWITPFTDLEYIIAPNYTMSPFRPFCTKLQLKYLDCLEAYGFDQGRKKCAELYFDLVECMRSTTQIERYNAIQSERMKQYKAGKLDKLYADPPPLDSYMYL